MQHNRHSSLRSQNGGNVYIYISVIFPVNTKSYLLLTTASHQLHQRNGGIRCVPRHSLRRMMFPILPLAKQIVLTQRDAKRQRLQHLLALQHHRLHSQQTQMIRPFQAPRDTAKSNPGSSEMDEMSTVIGYTRDGRPITAAASYLMRFAMNATFFA